ncbi:MAG: 50S ribosomal protein L18 [Bacteroides sp.]|nr:MAG: 50S ribosomal protein L18 [Bacteroides sp.]
MVIKKNKKNYNRLRLSIYKSNKFIYAQIIDDLKSCTLVSANSLKYVKSEKNNLEIAKEVGLELASKSLKQNIKKIYLDRKKYKYHGKIKSLTEGARLGGLDL